MTDADHQRLRRARLATGRRPEAVPEQDRRTKARRRPRPVSPAERQRILDLYQTRRNGKWLSTAQVGRLVGRAASTVLHVVQDAGVLRDRRDAATLEVPDMTRRRVLRLRRETGWGWEKVSAALNIKPTVVRKVFEEAQVFVPHGPNSRAKVTPAEAEVIAGLYQQGQPATEVAARTGHDRTTINAVLRAAGVELRSFSEANSLAQLRSADRRFLGHTDIVQMATRWLAGAEVEELAKELDVAADLLWDKLAEVLADHGRCAGCRFACTAVCARDMAPITALDLPAEAATTTKQAAALVPLPRRRAPSRLTPSARSGPVVAAYRWTGSGYAKIAGSGEDDPQFDGQEQETDVVVRMNSRGQVKFDEQDRLDHPRGRS